jgi:hypothetical protein
MSYNINIVEPKAEIVQSTWTTKDCQQAILRAAGVCRRKNLLDKDYFKFYEKYIKGLGHFSLLEHSATPIVAQYREKVFTNIRDWLEIDNENSLYGSYRDLMEFEQYIPEKEELRMVDFDKCPEIKQYINDNIRQILIICSYFSAMQLVRHRSISWLCESSRHYDYTKEPLICTVNPFDLKAVTWESIGSSYEMVLKEIENSIPLEVANRNLTTYRQIYLIGTAHKKDWLIMCEKRGAGKGVQSDTEFIASKIKQLLEK